MLVLFVFLLLFKSGRVFCRCNDQDFFEHQRFDGWYNNRAQSNWGAADSELLRISPALYADGVYMIKEGPSPRELSKIALSGPDGLPSSRNRTAVFVFFCQVVEFEIFLTHDHGCPLELHQIQVSTCDEEFDAACAGNKSIPYLRVEYDSSSGQSPNNPRKQINHATSWIDGSIVYSTLETRLNMLRSFKNGTFSADPINPTMPPRNHLGLFMEESFVKPLPDVDIAKAMFMLGDERMNQNPALLSFGILFFRWHNVLANRIQKKNPLWSDELVFQRARRFLIAHLQNIILYEFVPALIGPEDRIAAYTRYRPEVHPGVSYAFKWGALPFWHSLVPPGVFRRDAGPDCHFLTESSGEKCLRLCKFWWLAHVSFFFEI